MQYIFYADIYFIQNFMIKIAVLYLSLYCNKVNFETTRVKGIVKICFASGIGTVIEMLGLLLSGSYSFFVVCIHILELPIMFALLLGYKRKHLLHIVVSGYFFIMLINAVLEGTWNCFGENGTFLFFLIFSCGVVVVAVRMWTNYKNLQRGIYLVELLAGETILQINGFYDSGNCLKDTYTKKGVHIISHDIISKLELGNPVYIPYQSLGNENGLLEVYYLKEMVIEGEKQRIRLENCPLGVTKDKLFEGKKYQIILNEEVF